MRFRFSSKLRSIFLVLIIFAASVAFSIVGQTAFASSQDPPYDPAVGQAIVSQAELIATGESPWLNGCVPNMGDFHCVPYSWGAGHGAEPGPSYGNCNKYTGHKPCIAPQTFGLDCSGFTRWVYALVYNKDVLGPKDTTSQKTRPNVKKVTKPEPGDLVFFPGHVGIYIGKSNGKDLMIDAPHSYDKPHSTYNSSSSWVQAYVRIDTLKPARVSGYYRYTLAPNTPTPISTTPTPTPTVTPTTVPQLAQFYCGTKGVPGFTSGLDLVVSQEDQQGNFSGAAMFGLPISAATVGSGGTITFTVADTVPSSPGYQNTWTYTGTTTVTNNLVTTMSGTVVVTGPNGSDTESWKLMATTGYTPGCTF